MKKVFLFLGAWSVIFASSAFPAHAAGFAIDFTQGVEIGSALLGQDPAFEISGAVFHPGRGTYIVVSDEGQIAEVDISGAVLHEWSVGSSYDLEDVTLIDSASSVVYLADENTSAAVAFDLATGNLTGKRWSFASHIYETPEGAGLEGLTYVPDGHHPFGVTVSGGVFYAGWQQDGDIYVFEPNLSTGDSTYREELHLEKGLVDLSALSYDRTTRVLYVVYDGADRLEQRSADGVLLSITQLPGNNQEAFSARSLCATAAPTVLVGEDGGGMKLYASTASCSTVKVPRHRRR